MPDEQYSNLQQQVKVIGLDERWKEARDIYSCVNLMFDDMAFFMVQNNLTEEDVLEEEIKLTFRIMLSSCLKAI
ncbi:hypothetical protein ACH0BF_02065 [Pseudobacillus sp. 179-B 2D1 NHS]|uniref:hypothetical protein n=1 Tax=Pseudobacillus sp. 179-B 2D1 NHS TaxID=3374292 RepID=UPI00387A5FF1